jgi:hypothetical protein
LDDCETRKIPAARFLHGSSTESGEAWRSSLGAAKLVPMRGLVAMAAVATLSCNSIAGLEGLERADCVDTGSAGLRGRF